MFFHRAGGTHLRQNLIPDIKFIAVEDQNYFQMAVFSPNVVINIFLATVLSHMKEHFDSNVSLLIFFK